MWDVCNLSLNLPCEVFPRQAFYPNACPKEDQHLVLTLSCLLRSFSYCLATDKAICCNASGLSAMLSRYSGKFWKTTTATFFKMYLKTCWHLTSVIFSVDQRNVCFLDISLFFCCPSPISPDTSWSSGCRTGRAECSCAMDWLESCFRYFMLCIVPRTAPHPWTETESSNIFLKDSIPCNKTRSPWDFPPKTST